MLVDIRAKHGRLDRSLEEQLERRLRFALARFGGRIRRISAFLEDINGPRGGEDQRCRIEVSLVPSGSIMAEATHAEVASAVGLRRSASRVVYETLSIASVSYGRGGAASQVRAPRRHRISERMKRDEQPTTLSGDQSHEGRIAAGQNWIRQITQQPNSIAIRSAD